MLLATVLGLDAKTWEAEDIPMVHLTDARRYVCDPDEILSQAERDSIDSYLLRLDKQCGVESVFVIVKRVSNGDTFRFAQDLGNRQGVGSKKTNRGLVVVVAVEDRRYFIAPGEGLEKDLTDIECDDIGRACIVANMKRGEPGRGRWRRTGNRPLHRDLHRCRPRHPQPQGQPRQGWRRWRRKPTLWRPLHHLGQPGPHQRLRKRMGRRILRRQLRRRQFRWRWCWRRLVSLQRGPTPTGSQSPPRLRRQQQNYYQKTISIWNQRS